MKELQDDKQNDDNPLAVIVVGCCWSKNMWLIDKNINDKRMYYIGSLFHMLLINLWLLLAMLIIFINTRMESTWSASSTTYTIHRQTHRYTHTQSGGDTGEALWLQNREETLQHTHEVLPSTIDAEWMSESVSSVEERVTMRDWNLERVPISISD